MNKRDTGVDANVIAAAQQTLEQHPVYALVKTPAQLVVFMQHHVYSVWDFMSLLKYLHGRVSPKGAPWMPGESDVRRFLNELLLEEETDEVLPELGLDKAYLSHFELYLTAMRELGADTAPVAAFTEQVATNGIDAALTQSAIPEPSRVFMQTTFGFINQDKPHCIAAALAFGREHIIPAMFRRILAELGVSAYDAPAFHFYLNRHIHLDEGHHGPLSLRLVDLLCDGDPVRFEEAEAAAQQAVAARINFWDGVGAALTDL